MSNEALIRRLEAHHRKVANLHREALELLVEAAPLIKNRDTPLEELNDIGFLLREVASMHDEVRKEANAHQDLGGKMIAYRRIMDTMNEENPDLTVRSRLATGYPEMRTRTTIPKKGTPEYAALCKHFGLGDSAIDGALFAPHYVRFAEYVQSLQEAGEKLPPGVELSVPLYSTVFRRKQ